VKTGPLNWKNVRVDCGTALKDERGETALMKAAVGGHTECVVALLDADLGLAGQRGMSGGTALMHAVDSGQSDFLKAMLNRGRSIPIQYYWAILSRPVLFYPEHMFGQEPEKNVTVFHYLEQNDMQQTAKLFRARFQSMIDKCTMTFDNPPKPENAIEALQVRSALWKELGDIEKAEADLKRSRDLNTNTDESLDSYHLGGTVAHSIG